MAGDIFSQFLQDNSETESPAVYYRWSLLASIGALLGRSVHLKHGHFNIYPNLYTMLIGGPGTRKSTAIKLSKNLLRRSGYNTIAADKTSKEKFLVDLEGAKEKTELDLDDILDENIFGSAGQIDPSNCKEVFIMADEANDFFGHNNIEFLSLLGNLWDYEGNFTYRIKTGKSLSIPNPTVSILSANTPTGFAMGFPTEILGQGFFSRLLLIYGEPNGRRYAFPKGLSPELSEFYIQYFRELRQWTSTHRNGGITTLSKDAERLLERIYSNHGGLNDPRFESYSTRRFGHLLKLCLIYCCTRFDVQINTEDVLFANTVLSRAELFMPRALGEFGKAKNSDVSHKIVELINQNDRVTPFKEIFKAVHQDVDSAGDVSKIIQTLCAAEKIQAVPGGMGFLPVRKIVDQIDSSLVDYSILTEEEKDMKI